MKIAVFGSDQAFKAISGLSTEGEWQRAGSIEALLKIKEADALFNLAENAGEMDYSSTGLPVFINSVSHTLKEMKHAANVVRINGWNGFLERSIWETSGVISETHAAVMQLLQRKFVVLPDEPGFISARIIGMIINEGFFAKGENVSTEEEIDIAMKLGTNYPKGPFEWMKEIGIQNIYTLLKVLDKSDNRYHPSPLLQSEASLS